MTDSEERLLIPAKLGEQVRGEMEGGDDLLDHAGLPITDEIHSHLSFLDGLQVDGATFGETELGQIIDSDLRSRVASDAMKDGHGETMSYLSGITEQDLNGSTLRLALQLDQAMTNNDATAFVAGVGNPNTGKTNLVALLTELRRETVDDLLVISNSRSWSGVDVVATSAYDLAVTCLEYRDRPKFVFIDEGSTHFDARTNSREVAVQFTPFAKRFAKINVDVFATVGHTGKDLHPEVKRLVTLAFYKYSKKEADFFESWPADADMPSDRLFDGTVDELEPALDEPDPDDAAPWAWNLPEELFADDLGWGQLLAELRNRGPAE